jgi:hypothetical protein
MAEAVPVASEAATEAPEQQDDQKNNENGAKRHGHAPIKPSNAEMLIGRRLSLQAMLSEGLRSDRCSIAAADLRQAGPLKI